MDTAIRERQEALRENPLPLPSRKYKTVVIDPPWTMSKYGLSNYKHFGYPMMSVAEIKALQLPIDTAAWVFLWTTNRYLPVSFEVLEAWGLQYVFTMAWLKNGGPQTPVTPQFNTEFVVVGKRGAPQFINTKHFFTGFGAPRTDHSAKPRCFYDTLRRVTPTPRIDMFNRRPIDGFDVWGDESSICLPSREQRPLFE